MYAGSIQFLAVLLFAACMYHSLHNEGRHLAQQWFGVGYLFALLYQVLLVQFGVISYSDQMVQFGSAPTLTSLLLPALFYVAYFIARQMNPGDQVRPMILLIFLLTPALALPVDATALGFDWWSFPSQSRSFLDGVPYFVPLGWGLVGALFYSFIRLVRRIRLRGNGQLYALILGTPLMAGVSLLLVLVSQLVVAVLGLAPSDLLLNGLMALLLLALPIALATWQPRLIAE